MSDPSPSPVEAESRIDRRELAVAFMRFPPTHRMAIIERVLGPQEWPERILPADWRVLLREIRERGLVEQLAEEVRRG